MELRAAAERAAITETEDGVTGTTARTIETTGSRTGTTTGTENRPRAAIRPAAITGIIFAVRPKTIHKKTA